MILVVVAFTTGQPVFFAAYFLCAVALVAGFLGVLRGLAVDQLVAAAIVASVLTFGVSVNSFRDETILLHFAISIISLLTALIFTKLPRAYLRASMFTLVATQALVVAYLAAKGIRGRPLEAMIPGSSSNVITSNLVALQINYAIAKFLLQRRSTIMTGIVTLVICFVGYGRGSILAALAVLATLILFQLHSLKQRRGILYVGGVVLLCGAIAVVAWQDNIVESLVNKTKLASGFSSPRVLMIQDYLDRMDGVGALVGSTYEGTIIDKRYNGNPHNSFIYAHHFFGLPYLLIVLILPLLLIARQRGLRTKAFIAAMTTILYFRAFTQPILFPTPFDLFYYAIYIGLVTVSSDVRATTPASLKALDKTKDLNS